MRFFILPAALCVAIVASLPSNYHVVHERREISSEWSRRDLQVDRSAVLPTVSIGLTQQLLQVGEQFLLDVSDPTSANYGQHWTPEQVVDTFAPEEETINAVKAWLIDSGISEDRIELTLSRNFLRMNLTIAEVENLLKTEYGVFEHKENGKRALAVEEYSVPAHIQRHIDYITPTLQATELTKNKPRDNPTALRVWKQPPKFTDAPPDTPPLQIPGLPQPLQRRDTPGVSSLVYDLSVCGTYITRACIQQLYNMPNGSLSTSSLAVFELFDQSFVAYDLLLYLYNFVTSQNYAISPHVYVMNDTVFTPGVVGGPTGEGDLDVQLAQGIVYPLDIWWYQANNMDVFFDAVDSSYCSVTSAGPCGSTPLASVISISWGWYESIGDASQIRVCNEFMKLGLLGTTVLFSSGDSGVGSSCTTFRVLESASCPYVTAVGATQLANGSSISTPEVASNSYWSTGGGFSNIWPLPSWQASAMKTYYASYAPSYTSAQFNNSQKVRGYPDISAIGHNILTVSNTGSLLADGTSASAPIVAGLITLINQQRLAKGKSTVGFINPVLYANPGAMNDIVSGNNPGCGTNGFSAVPGWDPVTGLGTPNYAKLLQVWMALA